MNYIVGNLYRVVPRMVPTKNTILLGRLHEDGKKRFGEVVLCLGHSKFFNSSKVLTKYGTVRLFNPDFDYMNLVPLDSPTCKS